MFRAEPREHLSVAKHLTAEVEEHEFVPGKGMRTVWKARRKANHWLDCCYMATAAGHRLGAAIVETEDDETGESWFEKQRSAA